eukprot:15332480-Ditylum_brightwellii.AAC.1
MATRDAETVLGRMPASFASKKGRDHLSAVRGLLHVCVAISNLAHPCYYRVSQHGAGSGESKRLLC